MSITTKILELQDEVKRTLADIEVTDGKQVLPLVNHPLLASTTVYREDDLFTFTFEKAGGGEAPTDEVFPKQEGRDPIAEYRAPMALVRMPLDGAAVYLAALYREILDAKFQKMFEAALELGAEQAGGISLYPTMCEPGYQSRKAVADPEVFKGYLTANWNHIDRELGDWLEESDAYESGFWSDEWIDCIECGGLIRSSGDSYSWRMYGQTGEDGVVCGDCLKKDIPTYLERLEGRADVGITIPLDPAQHGYVKVNAAAYENGWHPGQDDDPKAMSKTLRLNGVHRFLWDISAVGQFDVHFDLYLHESIQDKLVDVRTVLQA